MIKSEFQTDIAAQDPNKGIQNISYFISDGASSTNPSNNNFIAYMNAEHIDSYSVGIGNSLPSDLTNLNYIHNVDSLGKGSADNAIIVADSSQLESELLSTVPTAFGGNIKANGSIQNVQFGADDGYVESIDIDIGEQRIILLIIMIQVLLILMVHLIMLLP